MLADLLGPAGQELIRKAQEARPTLEELVQARVKEAGIITTITDERGKEAANTQVEAIVALRKRLEESEIRSAANIFYTLHRTLTGWLSGWDKLLEAREKSLTTALARYHTALEEAKERERQRLQRIADEEALRKREEAEKEAARKAKEELDAAEELRQKALADLVGYLKLVGEKKAVAECEELAKRRSDNLNQVMQDIRGAQEALDSLSKGNTEEALAIMRFSREAPPPPPPPPPVIEPIAPAVVYVPPAELPSSLRGLHWVPHWEAICGHQGNEPECRNCQSMPRQYLTIDERAIRDKMKRSGEGSGGTQQNPNTTLIPGFRTWWTQEATTRRTP
jgi:hypothetical protein